MYKVTSKLYRISFRNNDFSSFTIILNIQFFHLFIQINKKIITYSLTLQQHKNYRLGIILTRLTVMVSPKIL